eukprot:gene21228-28144_t
MATGKDSTGVSDQLTISALFLGSASHAFCRRRFGADLDNALGLTLVHELDCFQQELASGEVSTCAVVPDFTSSQFGLTIADILRSVKDSAAATTAPYRDASSTRYGYALPFIIRSFRRRVDAELPGMYTWFADESLHLTIRALMG